MFVICCQQDLKYRYTLIEQSAQQYVILKMWQLYIEVYTSDDAV